MKKVILTLTAILTLTSCFTEDVCGEITGYNFTCNSSMSSDCVYWIYIDNNKEYVTYSTFNEARVGDYICLESVW